jgi:hypothetical protein
MVIIYTAVMVFGFEDFEISLKAAFAQVWGFGFRLNLESGGALRSWWMSIIEIIVILIIAGSSKLASGDIGPDRGSIDLLSNHLLAVSLWVAISWLASVFLLVFFYKWLNDGELPEPYDWFGDCCVNGLRGAELDEIDAETRRYRATTVGAQGPPVPPTAAMPKRQESSLTMLREEDEFEDFSEEVEAKELEGIRIVPSPSAQRAFNLCGFVFYSIATGVSRLIDDTSKPVSGLIDSHPSTSVA